MTNLFNALTEKFIPKAIREFSQREEIARARIAVATLLMQSLLSLSGLVACLGGLPLPVGIAPYTIISTSITSVLFPSLLIFFRQTGAFGLTGNIYGLFAFIQLTGGFAIVPHDVVPIVIIDLLFLPLFIQLIAGLKSGLVWAAIIAATPALLQLYWFKTEQVEVLSLFTLTQWLLFSGLLAFALFGFHHLTAQMAIRLGEECAKFAFDAMHDSLTGVSNRLAFDRRLAEALEYSQLLGEKIALIYIDLNDFKPINDRYGHHTGDVVLITIAHRLLDFARHSDTVARLGGDEFVILYMHIVQLSDLEIPIARIKSEIAKPIAFKELQLNVSASLGVVIYPDDGKSAEQLGQLGDARMYENKHQQKNARNR